MGIFFFFTHTCESLGQSLAHREEGWQKCMDPKVKQLEVQIPALLPSNMNLVIFPKPQLPHLPNGENNYPFLPGLM